MQEQSELETMPNNHTINIMWLNQKASSNQYVYPDKVANQISDYVSNWTRENPGIEITLWYDSQTTTPEQVSNTEHAFSNQSGLTLRLHDIRRIPIVRENPDIFSSLIPIYFKIDILKMMICLDQIEKDPKVQYAFFSDIDVEAKPLKSLCEEYQDAPFAMNKGDVGTENQFVRINGHDKIMIDTLKHVMNINLLLAKNTLNHCQELHSGGTRQYNVIAGGLNQTLYDSMKSWVIPLYLVINRLASLEVSTAFVNREPHSQSCPYDFEKDGYRPFGIDCFSSRAYLRMNINNNKQEISVEDILDFVYSEKVKSKRVPGLNLSVTRGNDHGLEIPDLKDIMNYQPTPAEQEFKCRLYENLIPIPTVECHHLATPQTRPLDTTAAYDKAEGTSPRNSTTLMNAAGVDVTEVHKNQAEVSANVTLQRTIKSELGGIKERQDNLDENQSHIPAPSS